MRTRTKICGITNVEDALCAVDAGADAIGLVFYDLSPRCVEIEQAAKIQKALPPFVTTVALFVNPELDLVESVIEQVKIDVLQFHGDETPAFCEQFSRPYFKALRMKEGIDLYAECERYDSAQALLLDAYKPGVPGGTGETFDWARIPKDLSKAVILAGGLEPGNVAEAIEQVQPYAVDVSGGVEAKKGFKDAEKVIQFVRLANIKG